MNAKDAAKDRVQQWAAGGIGGQVGGGLLLGLSWGSPVWTVIGLLVVGLAWLATMVAVVAKGVSLGSEVAREHTSA